ncbi:MAG: 8-amino-7-oxononanoate synthase [Longimicrobiaceae bacterium]
MDEWASSFDSVLAGELDALEASDLRRHLRVVEIRRGTELVMEGRAVVDFASNDYLGVASEPRVAQAIATAALAEASGAAAARLISGNHPLHEALERDLARFKGTEAVLLFSSGYMANCGALPALATGGDVLYSDALNHASLIDGCRLSRAQTRVFPHGDLDALEEMLHADRNRFRRRWIVVEGVYSMDGDLFPLDRAVELARRHGAWIYLDDAHGTGVLGSSGRGAAEHWGVEGEVEVTMGTLGKALGTSGAFIAGSAPLRELLLNRARSFVFTTGSPPALAAGALTALRVVEAEPERRQRLQANVQRMHAGMWAEGLEVPADLAGHIAPVRIGGAREVVQVGAGLAERGFWVGAVRPPTVPEGTSRLRITLSSAHTAEQIDALIDALVEILEERGLR